MGRQLRAFGLGLLVLVLIIGVTFLGQVSSALAFVAGDARLFYLLGAVLLFAGAAWLGVMRNSGATSVLLLCLPLLGAFALTNLRDAPFMWPNLPLWILSAAAGLSFRTGRRSSAIGPAGLLLLASAGYCAFYLPRQIKLVMSHAVDHPGPAFAFQAVGNGPVPLQPVPGKTLVIDFAQSWCMPCRAELPQIERVREELQDRRDIQFVIVATNAGGDTPQRFRIFAQQEQVSLPLAFDPGGKAHTAFGLHGFPSLVVLDHHGRVRFTHEGYNSAEANFRADLESLLRTLE
jgi:thiol-disulfide isomerase/thioredoxin